MQWFLSNASKQGSNGERSRLIIIINITINNCAFKILNCSGIRQSSTFTMLLQMHNGTLVAILQAKPKLLPLGKFFVPHTNTHTERHKHIATLMSKIINDAGSLSHISLETFSMPFGKTFTWRLEVVVARSCKQCRRHASLPLLLLFLFTCYLPLFLCSIFLPFCMSFPQDPRIVLLP